MFLFYDRFHLRRVLNRLQRIVFRWLVLTESKPLPRFNLVGPAWSITLGQTVLCLPATFGKLGNVANRRSARLANSVRKQRVDFAAQIQANVQHRQHVLVPAHFTDRVVEPCLLRRTTHPTMIWCRSRRLRVTTATQIRNGPRNQPHDTRILLVLLYEICAKVQTADALVRKDFRLRMNADGSPPGLGRFGNPREGKHRLVGVRSGIATLDDAANVELAAQHFAI
uniref:(northern house mosquito) hypothetical protein n=1 Tax=Culex pipiens TaxID=7175 RepID=A0A8D8HFR7_CULPI